LIHSSCCLLERVGRAPGAGVTGAARARRHRGGDRRRRPARRPGVPARQGAAVLRGGPGRLAQKASDDPHSLLRYGRLATQVRAAEATLQWAARELDTIGLNPCDAETAARGSLAVAQAKAFGSEVAVSVASELFALSGASAADAKYDLDRHWRNARTHSIHDPADWKYHHVAQYEVNGVLPPNHAQL
jgi:alkylation response protein AidB-like acyl-CoA dehydrogenase